MLGIFRPRILLPALLFELGRRQAGNFLELIGQMREAAVMHFMRNFRQFHIFIEEQFLYPIDLVANIESFDRDALCFREQVGHIGVIMVQLFAQVGGQVMHQLLFAVVDDIQDDVLYLLYEDILLVFE